MKKTGRSRTKKITFANQDYIHKYEYEFEEIQDKPQPNQGTGSKLASKNSKIDFFKDTS